MRRNDPKVRRVTKCPRQNWNSGLYDFQTPPSQTATSILKMELSALRMLGWVGSLFFVFTVGYLVQQLSRFAV